MVCAQPETEDQSGRMLHMKRAEGRRRNRCPINKQRYIKPELHCDSLHIILVFIPTLMFWGCIKAASIISTLRRPTGCGVSKVGAAFSAYRALPEPHEHRHVTASHSPTSTSCSSHISHVRNDEGKKKLACLGFLALIRSPNSNSYPLPPALPSTNSCERSSAG